MPVMPTMNGWVTRKNGIDMEVAKPVQMILVEYICDECEKGKMVQKGHPKRREVPWQYPHQCDNCGHVQWLEEPKYPRTTWKELETA